ncbi:MAG: hypothetical protein JRI25_12185 [Deltaproteobacteria bacterium]|nr:hypothetical protein [Deltaproteobacteria bacterium]
MPDTPLLPGYDPTMYDGTWTGTILDRVCLPCRLEIMFCDHHPFDARCPVCGETTVARSLVEADNA